MATLAFSNGKLEGETVELKDGKQVVGKLRSSDITVADPWISVKHAEIECDGGSWFIADLKSRKGTKVNGKDVGEDRQPLPDGATIEFGETKATFSAAGAAPAAASSSDDEDAGDDDGSGKKLSVRERIALRKKQRQAEAAAAAGDKAAAAAASSGADAATIDEVKGKEIELQNAIRDLTKTKKELDAAQKQIAALSSGSASEELQKQLAAMQKEMNQRDEQIHGLELALSEARAGLGADTGAVDDQVQALQAKLEEAEKEAAKYKGEASKLEKAVKRQDDEIERLKSDGGVGGYSGAEEEAEMLRDALKEKSVALDTAQAELLEQTELVEKLQNRINDYNQEQQGRRSSAEKQLTAMEEKVGEYLEQKHAAEKELQRFQKEYAEFEERVIELQASVDDLTERNDIMQYKLEQAEQKVGELVRGKLVEMQQKYDEIQQTNQQLQSLVEAYEEKIDEMDGRIEEMEAENEELEKLLEEERDAHEKTKQEAEKSERALRKRLQLAVGGGGGAGEPALEEAGAEA